MLGIPPLAPQSLVGSSILKLINCILIVRGDPETDMFLQP